MLFRIFSVLIIVAGIYPFRFAQAEPTEIGQQRASALFNLLLFIEWPESRQGNGEFHFCTLPGQTLDGMQTYTDRQVHKQDFRLVPLSADLDALADCHALYSSDIRPAKLNKILATAKNQSLLIVFEGKQGLEMGAMVGIELTQAQVILDINVNAMQQSRLHPHAQLLAIARRVVR